MITLHRKGNSIHRRLFSAAALIAALAAAPAPATASAPLRYEATGADPGTATLEIQAEGLVTMTALPFRLLLKDAAGQPLNGARVACDLAMPSMAMPENRPKISERDGAYAGEMVLTCTMGDWRMTCTAEDDRGMRRTLTFDLGRARLR